MTKVTARPDRAAAIRRTFESTLGPVPLWDFHEIAGLIAPRRLWLAISPRDTIEGPTFYRGPTTGEADFLRGNQRLGFSTGIDMANVR